MKTAIHISLILSSMLFISHVVKAQDKCEEVLTQASEAFATGHFHQIPTMLKDCLDKGQKKEWRQRAYLLLAQTYLLLEDPTGAENSYLEVLRANPEYTTDPARDPIDLVYLSSKFTASPIFSLYVLGGTNISFASIIKDNEAAAGQVNESYGILPGFQVGGGVDWNYMDNWVVSLGGQYLNTAYKFEKTIFEKDEMKLTERLSWLRIPVSVRYQIIKNKIRPYVYVGASADLILGSRAIITYSDQNYDEAQGGLTADQQESPVIKFKPKRNSFNWSAFIGAGVRYKIGLNYVFADIRYSKGMTNIVDTKNYLFDYTLPDRTSGEFESSGEPVTRWTHVDDFFRVNNLLLSVGYVHPLYKPRKLNKARSKSVLRSIKKQDRDAAEN